MVLFEKSAVLTPRGTLRYNITDNFVEEAEMDGKAQIEEVSEDHLLFESRFRTQPGTQGKLLLHHTLTILLGIG